MFNEIKTFNGKKINDVYPLENKTIIHIAFDDTNSILRLLAIGDCCSFSWFEELNDRYDSIIGKEIKSIDVKNDFIDLPKSNVQEYDQNTLIEIKFTDDTSFDFVLRNSSNGYYNGWLEIDIIHK